MNILSGLFWDQCFQSPTEGQFHDLFKYETARHVGLDVTMMRRITCKRWIENGAANKPNSLLFRAFHHISVQTLHTATPATG